MVKSSDRQRRNDSAWAIERNPSPVNITFIFLTSTRHLPSQAYCLPLGSNTMENPGKSAERKNPRTRAHTHFIYTRLILDLMRSLVNHWSPLTHASHCMTTSRPVAAAQTRARVSLTVQPKVLLCLSCHNPPYFQLGTSSEDVGLHIVRLGCVAMIAGDCGR